MKQQKVVRVMKLESTDPSESTEVAQGSGVGGDVCQPGVLQVGLQ